MIAYKFFALNDSDSKSISEAMCNEIACSGPHTVKARNGISTLWKTLWLVARDLPSILGCRLIHSITNCLQFARWIFITFEHTRHWIYIIVFRNTFNNSQQTPKRPFHFELKREEEKNVCISTHISRFKCNILRISCASSTLFRCEPIGLQACVKNYYLWFASCFCFSPAVFLMRNVRMPFSCQRWLLFWLLS